MKYLVIIGGTIHETPLLKRMLQEENFDLVIAADSGLNWAYQLGIRPDQMMGDFDSVRPEVLSYYQKLEIPMKTFPTRKDYTDSELALWAALDEAGPGDEIWILGGIGSRMDHTLANVFLLYEPLQKQVQAVLLDGLNEIRMLEGPCDTLWEPRKEQKYFSLLPFLGEVSGIDLEGFAYPKQNFTLRPGKCIAISNEINGPEGRLRFQKGHLLVVRSTEDGR